MKNLKNIFWNLLISLNIEQYFLSRKTKQLIQDSVNEYEKFKNRPKTLQEQQEFDNYKKFVSDTFNEFKNTQNIQK